MHALLLDIAKAAFGALHDVGEGRGRWWNGVEETFSDFSCCTVLGGKSRLAVGEMVGVGCWQADSKR